MAVQCACSMAAEGETGGGEGKVLVSSKGREVMSSGDVCPPGNQIGGEFV